MTRLTEALANADSGSARGKPVARWLLPAELAEISGLALTPDGRLFAHDDESARISEIDYRRGTIIKQFFVGKKVLRGDFEGLAYAEDRFFLLSSDGTLYEFREGAAEERVDYTEHDTRLGKECEFEGVAYDSTANALILACKNVRKKQSKDMLVFYRYSLGDSGGAEISEFTVPCLGGNRREWLEEAASQRHHRGSVQRQLRARGGPRRRRSSRSPRPARSCPPGRSAAGIHRPRGLP